MLKTQSLEDRCFDHALASHKEKDSKLEAYINGFEKVLS